MSDSKNVLPSTLGGQEICPACHGTGVNQTKDRVLHLGKCPACGGVGRIKPKLVLGSEPISPKDLSE
jgi:DnaJ-class molecular chaperone